MKLENFTKYKLPQVGYDDYAATNMDSDITKAGSCSCANTLL